MNDSILAEMYDVVISRRESKEEGSYTAYLFREGIDKILKKVGEECAETIIAAKNGEKEPVINETADLLYHLNVMLAELDIDVREVEDNLRERRKKSGNLKKMKQVDKNT
ncbi:MAG: phosphoribosyl-ATP diphosphatase [Clostridia bacterium]|nr:phosphoribosyl-ATP diphosphatase [Clostridia bacterium]